jgi:hypothetical protein
MELIIWVLIIGLFPSIHRGYPREHNSAGALTAQLDAPRQPDVGSKYATMERLNRSRCRRTTQTKLHRPWCDEMGLINMYRAH